MKESFKRLDPSGLTHVEAGRARAMLAALRVPLSEFELDLLARYFDFSNAGRFHYLDFLKYFTLRAHDREHDMARARDVEEEEQRARLGSAPWPTPARAGPGEHSPRKSVTLSASPSKPNLVYSKETYPIKCQVLSFSSDIFVHTLVIIIILYVLNMKLTPVIGITELQFEKLNFKVLRSPNLRSLITKEYVLQLLEIPSEFEKYPNNNKYKTLYNKSM